MTRLRTLLVLSILVAPATSRAVRADEPPAPAAERLQTSLQAFATRPAVAFEGSVTNKENPLAGMMAMAGIGGKAQPFQGEFEAWVGEGKIAVASKGLVPGFAVLSDGSNTLTRTLFRSDPPDVVRLRGEVLALLDRPKLVDALAKAAWTSEATAEGRTKLKAAITSPLLPEEQNMMVLMAGGADAKQTVEAEVEMGSNDELLEIRLLVTRVDTMKIMMDVARKSGAGGQLPPGVEGDGKPTTTYVLRVAGDAPSARLKATLEEMQALAQRK
jgi:hypothetical protein